MYLKRTRVLDRPQEQCRTICAYIGGRLCCCTGCPRTCTTSTSPSSSCSYPHTTWESTASDPDPVDLEYFIGSVTQIHRWKYLQSILTKIKYIKNIIIYKAFFNMQGSDLVFMLFRIRLLGSDSVFKWKSDLVRSDSVKIVGIHFFLQYLSMTK